MTSREESTGHISNGGLQRLPGVLRVHHVSKLQSWDTNLQQSASKSGSFSRQHISIIILLHPNHPIVDVLEAINNLGMKMDI